MLSHHLIQFFARSFGESPMLTEAGREFDFGAGQRQINRIANLLARQGVGVGDRVAILGENSAEHIFLLFAAAQIGAVMVPLNFRLAVNELAYIITDAEASLLLVTDEGSLAKADSLLQRIRGMEVFTSFESAEGHWGPALQACSEQVPADLPAVNENTPLLQLYTSGTTGRPKGVMLSHRNLLSLSLQNAAGSITKSGIGSRELIGAPMFHIGGLGTAAIALLAGGAVVLHRGFEPDAILDALEQDGITSVFLVPAMIQALLSRDDIRERDFSQLRRITYGASPISEHLLRQALEVFNCEFVQLFGQTETCGGVLSLTWPDHQKALAGRPELLRSCGRVMAGVQMKVCDPDGNEVAAGATGEFVVRSDTNMLSYWHMPEASAKTLRDGWVYTGDAGYVDEEGYAFLRDRLKDMVVTGGENVYPVEVENALSSHPAILEVAVIGVPDEKYGEALLAVVALRPGASLTVEELVAFARDKIAGYKIPRRLQLVAALPRNASGKVLKTELREPYWQGHERRIG